tara:strand:- start:6927 stop:7322 length:396 start_codon:yes stop_codon:yes gene_type:complete
MAEFKINLPTAKSLHNSISKEFKDSFEKKAMDAGPSVGMGLFGKNAAQQRVKFKKAQNKLRAVVRENKKRIKDSNLSVEQKKVKDKQLIENATKIDKQMMEMFGLKKSPTKKAIGGKVSTKKKQTGHNRLY